MTYEPFKVWEEIDKNDGQRIMFERTFNGDIQLNGMANAAEYLANHVKNMSSFERLLLSAHAQILRIYAEVFASNKK